MWSRCQTPAVVAFTNAPADAADPRFRLKLKTLSAVLSAGTGSHLIDQHGDLFRYEIDSSGADPPAVLLPFDQLFEQRVTAALRLWRALHNANPGEDPARLSAQQIERLTLSLRALDAKLAGHTYRQIAQVLSRTVVHGRAWKTHDVRATILRLTRKGMELMQGGYRTLLIHPYRRPPRKRTQKANLNIR